MVTDLEHRRAEVIAKTALLVDASIALARGDVATACVLLDPVDPGAIPDLPLIIGPGAAALGWALLTAVGVALYNTAFGLIVAIPSLIAHRFFRGRANDALHEMEQGAERLLHHLRRLPLRQF